MASSSESVRQSTENTIVQGNLTQIAIINLGTTAASAGASYYMGLTIGFIAGILVGGFLFWLFLSPRAASASNLRGVQPSSNRLSRKLVAVMLSSSVGAVISAYIHSQASSKQFNDAQGDSIHPNSPLPSPANEVPLRNALQKVLNLCWNPTWTSETVERALTTNGTATEAIRIEARGIGEGVEIRVCKTEGEFTANLAIKVAEPSPDLMIAPPKNCGDDPRFCMRPTHWRLQTKGRACSPWTDFSIDAGRIKTGKHFSPVWIVVSPEKEIARWDYNCVARADTTGLCYGGSGIRMEKTCESHRLGRHYENAAPINAAQEEPGPTTSLDSSRKVKGSQHDLKPSEVVGSLSSIHDSDARKTDSNMPLPAPKPAAGFDVPNMTSDYGLDKASDLQVSPSSAGKHAENGLVFLDKPDPECSTRFSCFQLWATCRGTYRCLRQNPDQKGGCLEAVCDPDENDSAVIHQQD